MRITQKESDQVGFDQEIIESFPSDDAIAVAPRLQLVLWFRFLRDPLSTEEQIQVEDIRIRLADTYPEGEQEYDTMQKPSRTIVEDQD